MQLSTGDVYLVFSPPFGLVVIANGKEEASTIKELGHHHYDSFWRRQRRICRGGSADPRTPFASASFSRVQPVLTGPAVHSQVTSLGEVGGPFAGGPK